MIGFFHHHIDTTTTTNSLMLIICNHSGIWMKIRIWPKIVCIILTIFGEMYGILLICSVNEMANVYILHFAYYWLYLWIFLLLLKFSFDFVYWSAPLMWSDYICSRFKWVNSHTNVNQTILRWLAAFNQIILIADTYADKIYIYCSMCYIQYVQHVA